MTDEEIKKLARECTEDFRKDVLQFFPTPLPNSMEVLIQEEQKSIVKVLQWLSDKFCIVEKEKVKALYSKMELDGNHVDSDNDWAVYEAMDELEKIFGEELFNDTEK